MFNANAVFAGLHAQSFFRSFCLCFDAHEIVRYNVHSRIQAFKIHPSTNKFPINADQSCCIDTINMINLKLHGAPFIREISRDATCSTTLWGQDMAVA